ncbi:MAG: hypothetical protein CM1200mP17_01270 [Woeseia sp.]|nr:MAG: hypothetical protein CM1200mP17_01270 [Woeseia sp.]|tara:strand:+ start:121 stop:750 length:630 start_codon:yes stop_codon:yes gene_type:complete
MKDLIKKHRDKLKPIAWVLLLLGILKISAYPVVNSLVALIGYILMVGSILEGEDSKRNKIKNILETLAWVLLLIGIIITSSPLRISASVVGAILIVCSILVGGYSMKIIEPLTSTWKRAIWSVVFLIVLNGILMEWTAINFSTQPHQTGWEFVGMIMLAGVIIPSSLFVTSFIGLWFEKIKIKLFFWIAVLILLGWVGTIWINSSSSWS